jgi:hypothetical protein
LAGKRDQLGVLDIVAMLEVSQRGRTELRDNCATVNPCFMRLRAVEGGSCLALAS